MAEKTIPERISEAVPHILWGVHVIGPDDVYAMPDYQTAVLEADTLNECMISEMEKSGIAAVAVPCLWVFGSERHALSLKNQLAEAVKVDLIAAGKGHEIKEVAEKIATCEGCSKVIREGDQYSLVYDGGHTCLDCTPTYQDVLDDPELLIHEETEDHLTAEQAKELCDSHVASGGSLTDKVGLV